MLFPVTNFMNQVFKLRNLTVKQRICFAQNAGCNRFVWNELISINKKEYEAYQEYKKKVEEVQDDPDKVAKIPKVNCPSLRPNDATSKLPAIKKEYPFLEDAIAQPLQQTARRWARAMQEAVSGKKGFPKWKKKFRSDSFCIPQYFEFDEANDRVKLPKIGWVRYYNSAKLKGTPKQITVMRQADGWYIVVSCKVTHYIDIPLDLPNVAQQAVASDIDPASITHISADIGAVLAQKVKAALEKAPSSDKGSTGSDGQHDTPSLDSIDIAALLDAARDEVLVRYALSDELKPKLENMVLGLDVGVAIAVALSNGASFEEIKTATDDYKQRQAYLDSLIAKRQRQLSRLTLHSNNYEELSQKIAKLHLKKRRVRDDFLHKLSSSLVKNQDHEIFAGEDLNLKGMTKSAKGTVDNPGKNVKQKSGLNRSLLNMGFGTFVWMLTYKLELTGRKLILVDPRNTSRTCAKCGHVSKQNRLTQAKFKCVNCGHETNADLNAAVNIKNRGLASLINEAGKREGQGMPRWPGVSSTKKAKKPK